VNWREFFATLKAMDYRGPLCIEREAGSRRVEDVRAAVAFLTEPDVEIRSL
jgi:sugar phosphate isomerase/epimerase